MLQCHKKSALRAKTTRAKVAVDFGA